MDKQRGASYPSRSESISIISVWGFGFPLEHCCHHIADDGTLILSLFVLGPYHDVSIVVAITSPLSVAKIELLQVEYMSMSHYQLLVRLHLVDIKTEHKHCSS